MGQILPPSHHDILQIHLEIRLLIRKKERKKERTCLDIIFCCSFLFYICDLPSSLSSLLGTTIASSLELPASSVGASTSLLVVCAFSFWMIVSTVSLFIVLLATKKKERKKKMNVDIIIIAWHLTGKKKKKKKEQ